MRQTPLVRKTRIRRGKPIARSSGPKRSSGSRLTQSVRDTVIERDGCCCVRCGVHLAGRFYSVHHRKPRSQGGEDTLANLICLCGSGSSECHGEVHRAGSRGPDGYLVPRNADPAEVPVLVHGRGRVLPVGDTWQPA